MAITKNPHADAERHNDEKFADQAKDAERLAHAQRYAPVIVYGILSGMKKPGDWYKPQAFTGHGWSADEVLSYALQKDEASLDEFAKLMTSNAADALKQAVSDFFGHEMAIDVLDQQNTKDEK